MKFLPKLTWRIWILIIVLIFSLLAIFSLPPKFLEKGVLITDVNSNSSAFTEGLRKGQVITSMDGTPVNNVDDFEAIILKKFPAEDKVRLTITTKEFQAILYDTDAPKIAVSNAPKSNIKTGLDITGGSRALVKAKDAQLTKEELSDLVDITRNRINIYGISDVKVVPVSDLSGDSYMLVEVAGATPKDLENLISQQGKFEAKIGNETVFVGGDKDITSVCSSPSCSRISSCDSTSTTAHFCNFEFVIYLSEESAQRHADITSKLGFNQTASSSQGRYLDKPLDLYLDGKLVDSLLISEGLKGSATTQIQISGSGQGTNRQDAFVDAQNNMKQLQTVLKTGSLPYQLEIVKLDTVSPLLGKEFIRIILLAGLASLTSVAIIVFIRYRKLKLSLALLITSFSEVIIILGIASLISWNLDLLSIAGILATIGTGIDQQIIILDESRQKSTLSLKQKMKRALTIILGAFFTGIASLIPLWWAGAGLLKGFVFTTIIGITAGILITRPAFTDIVNLIEEKK
ncbi:hypothetical protein COU57_04385 [Candidatus Pacearchaeota archaeon CG10_big_fil_rev_8_21_14_0_10_32_14]|nr:MAG: hypothetical protein COU57_04385 [Candidatus Pacearchaeota archaeon CG10_big_fil_rev_8_21_14_0_10_32_14]